MAEVFFTVIAAVFVVSLVSLIGIFALSLKQAFLNRILFFLVSFAAGTLLGAAFLDLLPEALESGERLGVEASEIFLFVVAGVLAFFAMEKFLHWYHCHKGKCDVHTFHYLSIVGDALHNFIDGAIIAASFLTSYSLGVVATVAIIAHEVPQEIGDYAILVYGGFGRLKALAYNFLATLSAFAGALIVLFLSREVVLSSLPFLLATGAGGFVYIATADLLPELHKENDPVQSLQQLVLLVLGVFFVIGAGVLVGHA